MVIWKAVRQQPASVGDYVLPDWTQALCWMIVATPFVMVVAWWIVYTCMNGALEVTSAQNGYNHRSHSEHVVNKLSAWLK